MLDTLTPEVCSYYKKFSSRNIPFAINVLSHWAVEVYSEYNFFYFSYNWDGDVSTSTGLPTALGR